MGIALRWQRPMLTLEYQRLRDGAHRRAVWFAENLRNENYENGDAIPFEPE